MPLLTSKVRIKLTKIEACIARGLKFEDEACEYRAMRLEIDTKGMGQHTACKFASCDFELKE